MRFINRDTIHSRPCMLLLGLMLLLMTAAANASQKRVALVIGNGAYVEGRLKNPVNDARLMTQTLVETGFEVTTLENATRRQMKEAISQFTRGLDEQSVGLFYFAGHGIEFDGQNYLIPVDAEITQEADVEYESINAGRLLNGLRQSNGGLNLVILDACRNNPYARSFRSSTRGLSRMQPASGSLIFYATEPGSVASDGQGDNGIFTRYLVDAIRLQGKNIENVFKTTAINVSRATNRKQVPYIEGVLLGEFYFNGKDKPKVSVATLEAGASSAETLFWKSVLAQPSEQMLDAYLRVYPNGHYAEIATIQLAMLSKPDAGSGEAAASSAAVSSGISGTYRATIEHHRSQWLRFGRDPLEVTLERQGNRVTGTFTGGAEGEIEGVVIGDEIEFEWYITGGGDGNATGGKGRWEIAADGNTFSGSWRSSQYEESGGWDLARIQQDTQTASITRPSSSQNYISLTGTYILDVAGAPGLLRKLFKRRNVDGPREMTLVQKGNQIEGIFDNGEGQIYGDIQGDTISFEWHSYALYGSGEWMIGPGNRQLDGSFSSLAGGGSFGAGQWTLTRVE